MMPLLLLLGLGLTLFFVHGLMFYFLALIFVMGVATAYIIESIKRASRAAAKAKWAEAHTAWKDRHAVWEVRRAEYEQARDEIRGDSPILNLHKDETTGEIIDSSDRLIDELDKQYPDVCAGEPEEPRLEDFEP
jgi:uncharacterized membrane protein